MQEKNQFELLRKLLGKIVETTEGEFFVEVKKDCEERRHVLIVTRDKEDTPLRVLSKDEVLEAMKLGIVSSCSRITKQQSHILELYPVDVDIARELWRIYRGAV